MPSQIQTIVRHATKLIDEPLNILTWPTHERSQEKWSKTGHNFYMWTADNLKPWVHHYAPIPQGHYLLDGSKGVRQIPDWLVLDLIFSQNKGAHWHIATQIARQLKLPIVNITHTLPPPNWNKTQLAINKNMRANIEVFITDYSRRVWGYDDTNSIVINHGVDTNLFCPKDINKDKHILVVANDYINRRWCLGFDIFAKIIGDFRAPMIPFKVVGDTKGFSKAAENTAELINEYQKCGVFLNTSTVSPMPTSLLEAASCGCAIVSTNNCAIPELIKHGENGFLSNDPDQLRGYCRMLLDDPKLAAKMGAAARETILQKFTLERFVREWDELFRKVCET